MDDLIDRILALDYMGPRIECGVCGRIKNPIGRSVHPYRSGCDDDCPGHRREPFPSQLHPGENASEFGYVPFDSKAVAALICHARKLREGE